MSTHAHRPPRTQTGNPTGAVRAVGSRLRLVAVDAPSRYWPKPLGVANDGPAETIGLRVADARHHVHVQGVTGAGKSTWLAGHVLAEARAGRGVVLLDCQGDLARHVLERLPTAAGERLVILDPTETQAPPTWNVLAPPTPTWQPPPVTTTGHRSDTGIEPVGAGGGEADREWAAENVVGVFRRLYAAWWGPRMDDVLRAACLTVVRRPGATLGDVIAVLTREEFRQRLLARWGEPEGLEGFWEGYEGLSPGQRAQLAGPVLSRLRSVLSRRFARDLLGAATSTVNLSEILDGGILIARLPKGEIGEHTCQLVGSLLLAGLWSAATRRASLPPERRCDATVVVDECHNFLHLPIGVGDALAEARGYRLSWVLAHQHLAQLPGEVRDAVDANARNKLFFTVSPNDASKLVRHVAPYFAESDLSRRPAFEVVARTVHHGHDVPAFTLATPPLPPPVPGRAEQLRALARARTGVSAAQRAHTARRHRLDAAAVRFGAPGHTAGLPEPDGSDAITDPAGHHILEHGVSSGEGPGVDGLTPRSPARPPSGPLGGH